MFTHKTKFAALALILSIGSLGVASLVHGSDATTIAYLKGKQQNAWTTMALASAGETPSTAYLGGTNPTSATDIETAILAYTAVAQDPRTAGSKDLVAALKATASGGQIGDATLLNDDIFGILALASAGVPASDPVVASAKAFVLSHQNADGGFGYASAGTSDTNMTAGAIMALVAVGTPASDQALTKAVNYLKGAQNADGGFPYDPKSSYGTDSDAGSDAWVMMAFRALGTDPTSITKSGKDPVSNLRTFADASGYFHFQAGTPEDAFSTITSAYALIALSGKSLPVHTLATVVPLAPEVSFHIEGKDAELCAGTVRVRDALELVKLASVQCNTTYHITDMSFGPYLDAIGPDTAAGVIGWMYLVNNASPSVGAADYVLKSGDDVLWYYGDYGLTPTRVTPSTTTTMSGGTITVTVEAYSGTAWSPLAGATVSAGALTSTTNASGNADLTLPDGTYRISASKSGAIRSAVTELTFGTPTTQSIPLSVTIPGGTGSSGTGNINQTPAGMVSFSVETTGSEVAFGSLTPGKSATKTVTLTNQSTSAVRVGSTVTGDSVFRNALSLDGIFWRRFTSLLDANGHKDAVVSLTIPGDAPVGTKNGALVFWATPQ